MKTYNERLNLAYDPFEPGRSARNFFTGGNRGLLLDSLVERVHYGNDLLLVTGCLGSGKTALAMEFCASFSDEAVCAPVSATLFMNSEQFLEKLAAQLDLEPDDPAAIERLAGYATDLELGGASLVLVIDDAHEMSSEVLQTLSRLLQLVSDSAIHVLMLGESQLGNMLEQALDPVLRARVEEFELDGMGSEATLEYVNFKLACAGYDGPPPLSGAVLGSIVNASNGIPGTVNALVSDALERECAAAPGPGQTATLAVNLRPYWALAAVLVMLLFAVLIFPPADDATQLAADSEARTSIPVLASNSPAPDAALDAVAATPVEPDAPATPPAQVAAQPAPASGEISRRERSTPVAPPVAPPATPSVAPPVVPREAGYSEFERRLLAYPADSYTVQVMGSRNEASVRRFLESTLASQPHAYFESRYQDRPWFVVVVGNYPDREAAGAALAALPESVRSLQPWVRSLGDIQAVIQRIHSPP